MPGARLWVTCRKDLGGGLSLRDVLTRGAWGRKGPLRSGRRPRGSEPPSGVLLRVGLVQAAKAEARLACDRAAAEVAHRGSDALRLLSSDGISQGLVSVDPVRSQSGLACVRCCHRGRGASSRRPAAPPPIVPPPQWGEPRHAWVRVSTGGRLSPPRRPRLRTETPPARRTVSDAAETRRAFGGRLLL